MSVKFVILCIFRAPDPVGALQRGSKIFKSFSAPSDEMTESPTSLSSDRKRRKKVDTWQLAALEIELTRTTIIQSYNLFSLEKTQLQDSTKRVFNACI